MMTYLKMNKNIFLYCVSIFLFITNLGYTKSVQAKPNCIHSVLSDLASYPNNLINILTAKKYFIIEANMDKVIDYKLSKISLQLQNEIDKRSIHNIEIAKKDNDLIIFYKNALDSTNILNIIQILPKNILNNAEVKNELIGNQLQMTLTIPKQSIKKELYLKSKWIIQDVLMINNIHAIMLPMALNKFIIIPIEDNKNNLSNLFQNVGNVTLHLVNENSISHNTSSIDTIILPFLFSQHTSLPIYKQQLMSGQSIINADSKFDPYLQSYSVNINFDNSNKEQLYNITRQNVDKIIATVMNNKIIFASHIRAPIYGGRVMIEGNFSQQQANAIANLLSLNYIPITFKVAETERLTIFPK